MAQSRRLSRTREYHPVHSRVGSQPGLPFAVSCGIHPPIHPHFLFPGPVQSIHHDALATSTDIIQVSVPSPSPPSRHVSEGGIRRVLGHRRWDLDAGCPPSCRLQNPDSLL
ncbi:hypothetical protein CPAR01_06342 [Colletotrichum paranaense]|uniref:Uncharacterized protein n=1 Tax=Colletotrichum paranaense TaxID=1914294 RepID=A0ABQ9SLP0_9PEZI|nr:uncharacterized protein CPAR01_06342 [Colletotrichum paranaense]KAK1540353.1 hypothetical protein CPAR01_06342 [Colletotrichum paranaense]